MAVKFTCPHCEHVAEVDDAYVGQSGDCAVCGKPITVEPDEQDTLAPRAAGNSSSSGGGAVFVLLLTLGGMTLLIAFVVGLVIVSIPSTQFAQGAARKEACASNLVRIGKAMLDYHEDNGHFPPAHTVGLDGQPKHSWRVLLLPYLGEHALYQEYDMSAPWDQNSWRVQPMPAVYHCVDDEFADASTETSYVVVSGPGMVFNGAKTTRLEDITDGPENTILVVEIAAAAQDWLEPKDLDRAAMNLAINSGSGNEIGSYHEGGGAHVLMADGTVRWLDDLTTAQVLSSLLTIDAGDGVQP